MRVASIFGAKRMELYVLFLWVVLYVIFFRWSDEDEILQTLDLLPFIVWIYQFYLDDEISLKMPFQWIIIVFSLIFYFLKQWIGGKDKFRLNYQISDIKTLSLQYLNGSWNLFCAFVKVSLNSNCLQLIWFFSV